MQSFSTSPREMLCSFWRNRRLTLALIKREVIGRYKGSFLGIFWSLFSPVFMLVVYTFVFSFVLKARWHIENNSRTEFALVLFSGLIIFNIFAECANKAPGLLLSNTNYVKKVVFPLEILPWVTVGASLFHAAISLAVWLIAYVIFFGIPHVSVLLLPLILLPFTLMVMGVSWFLASLGVYLRDVTQVMGVITTALMFISPIFYPATALPEEYQKLLFLNPLTIVIEQTRDTLYWAKELDYQALGVYSLISLAVAWLGFAWFQKTRKGFADVL